MDEAVLRIILQESGQIGAAGATASGGAPTSPTGGQPPPYYQTPGGQPHSSHTGRFAPLTTGPITDEEALEQAKKRRQREENLQKIDEAYHDLYPTPKKQFDAAVEAQRLLDTRKRKAEVQEKLDELDGTKERKRQEELTELMASGEVAIRAEIDLHERERKLAEIEARAYLATVLKEQEIADEKEKAQVALEDRQRKLLEIEARAALKVVRAQQQAMVEDLGPAPFDPLVEARKRREKERQRAQVDAAYQDEYGEDEAETQLSKLMGLASRFRGTIGGLAGTVVGAVLDVMAEFQRTKREVAKKERQEKLLREAEEAAIPKAPAPDVLDALPADVRDKKPYKPPKLHGPMSEEEMEALEPGAAESAGFPQKALPADAPSVMDGMRGAGKDILGAAAGSAPVIAAVAAVASKINQAIIDGVKSAVAGVGRAASWVASADNDPSRPIEALGSAASAAGEKMTALSPELGYFTIAVGETGKALAELMRNLDQTAQRYGEYSPEIAQAQAMAEVKATLGDLRRSREAGPELARYVRAQAELQDKFENIKVKLLTRLLAVVNPMLERLEVMVDGGEKIAGAIQQAANPLSMIASAANTLVGMKQDDRMPEVSDPTDVILKAPGGQLGQIPAGFPGARGGE